MDFGFLGVTSLLASLRLCMVKSVHTSVPLRKCLGRYLSDLRGLDCSWCRWGSLIDTGGEGVVLVHLEDVAPWMCVSLFQLFCSLSISAFLYKMGTAGSTAGWKCD